MKYYKNIQNYVFQEKLFENLQKMYYIYNMRIREFIEYIVELGRKLYHINETNNTNVE